MKDVAIIGRPLRLTATNTTLAGVGLIGLLVATSTAGTVTIADSTGTLLNAMPVVAGTYYSLQVRLIGAVTITVGGTLDALLTYTS